MAPGEAVGTHKRDPWTEASYCGEDYHEHFNGLGPYTGEKWRPFFRHVAMGIVTDSHPCTTIEFGCAGVPGRGAA